MADKKPPASGPASAPELSAEEKQAIEAKLEADKPKNDPIELRSKPNDPSESENQTEPAADEATEAKPQGGRIRRFVAGYWRHKKWTLPLTVVVILAVLAAVPATRFALAGYVISQEVKVTVNDTTTKKPVTSADVTIDGMTYKTNKDGQITITGVKPGKHQLKVSKKYYRESAAQISVPLNKGVTKQFSITATGRQVPVSVVNKVSGKPLSDVTLKASGTEVKTDKEGKAVIVLPADKSDLPITLSNGGYNNLEARVKVTDQIVKENTFGLVPAGKLYFLSKQSGKIDVVKTDLDGGNRQTVVAGTGKEEEGNTVLLASRDWKFLALHSKRDSGLPKLYLIDTSTDKMTEMDSGDASFQLIGWNDHEFVYRVNRNSVKFWQANAVALKSFNADKKQILTIDQTASEVGDGNGYYQTFSNAYLVEDKLVYAVGWDYYYAGGAYQPNPSGRNLIIRAAATNTVSKKDIRSWPIEQYSSYLQIAPYEPHELYLSIYSNQAQKNVYFEYENGEVKDIDINEDKFRTAYATYLESPNGKQTLWNEVRDGKATFFVGDEAGENEKQIGVLDEFQAYGWYSDDYLLVSKKGSELHIMPVAGGAPLKVADYHKPQLTYRGYGGGYGGL